MGEIIIVVIYFGFVIPVSIELKLKDLDTSHLEEQQEQAFPQGEAIWEMTMIATWLATLRGAQSHSSWARQPELVRLW